MTPDHLFDPGSYTLAVWNPAEGITVSGTTATVAAATGNDAGSGAFISNGPGLAVHQRAAGADREGH